MLALVIDVMSEGRSPVVAPVGPPAYMTPELSIQVPYNTSLKLHATNGGDIVVDHIVGEVEIDNTNGNATATHVSGAAVVHALNGKVLVSLDKVSGDKPMSFSSLNGDIDVTLPADMKARVKLKSDNGAIYSDFDIALAAAADAPTDCVVGGAAPAIGCVSIV